MEYAMAVYVSLLNVYERDATLWKFNYVSRGQRDCYTFKSKDANIAKFVSKHVMAFLYRPHFAWKMDACFVNHTHGALRSSLCLRAYLISRRLSEERQGKGKASTGDIDDRFQVCDVCSVSLDQFEFIYHCSADINDRCDICLHCVYSIIRQSGELKQLLTGVLADGHYVNQDCVEMIVAFVVGKVVKVDKE